MALSLRRGLDAVIRVAAAADNPPAGQRLLYPKTDGWYDRDSAGVETRLGQPWTEQILGADYTNSTVTATDVFAGFTPAANTRYLVDVLLMVFGNAATTGVQTALAGPATGVTRSGVKIVSASAATTDLISHTALNTFQAAIAGLTTPNLLTIQAILAVGATPAVGNVRVQARSEVAAAAITVAAGSSMRWRVI